jgi:hypothetical protein
VKGRFSNSWRRVPAFIRKPTVLTLGLLLVIAAGLTGPLPGPGGIPLFLLAIALLATEFHWAEIIRDKVLAWLLAFGNWFRVNPVAGALVIAGVIFGFIGFAILASRFIGQPFI